MGETQLLLPTVISGARPSLWVSLGTCSWQLARMPEIGCTTPKSGWHSCKIRCTSDVLDSVELISIATTRSVGQFQKPKKETFPHTERFPKYRNHVASATQTNTLWQGPKLEWVSGQGSHHVVAPCSPSHLDCPALPVANTVCCFLSA